MVVILFVSFDSSRSMPAYRGSPCSLHYCAPKHSRKTCSVFVMALCGPRVIAGEGEA
jgi:hypothetical protein